MENTGCYLYVTVCIHTHMVVPFFVLFLAISLLKGEAHVEKLPLSNSGAMGSP